MIRINTISYCFFHSIYRSDGTLGMERVIVRRIILIIIIVIMFLLLIFNAKYNDTKLFCCIITTRIPLNISLNAGSSTQDHMFYEKEITKKWALTFQVLRNLMCEQNSAYKPIKQHLQILQDNAVNLLAELLVI